MKGPESCDGMIEMSARVSRKHETRSQSVAGNGNRVGGDLTRQFQSVTGKLEDYSPRNMILCLKFIVTLSRHTKRQGDGSVLNIISYSWRNVVLWLEGRVQFPGTLTRQSQGVSRDWTSIGLDNYSPSNEKLKSELDGRIRTLRWEGMVHFPGNMTRQSQNITKEWNSIEVTTTWTTISDLIIEGLLQFPGNVTRQLQGDWTSLGEEPYKASARGTILDSPTFFFCK